MRGARFSYILYFIYPQHKVYPLNSQPHIMKCRAYRAGASRQAPPVVGGHRLRDLRWSTRGLAGYLTGRRSGSRVIQIHPSRGRIGAALGCQGVAGRVMVDL